MSMSTHTALARIDTPDAASLTRQLQHALDREQRLLSALDAGSAGIWDWDLESGVCSFSDVWLLMLGYKPGELAGHVSTWEALVHPHDKPMAAKLIEQHLGGDSAFYECEHRLRCKDGSWGWVLARGRVVSHFNDGRPLRLVGTHVDIRARKEAETKITFMARHDTLTGLFNRAHFHERLNEKLGLKTVSRRRRAVLCLDLDRFKAVNDTFGHLAGDAVLCALARRMKTLLRGADTFARLGGDEFGILIEDASDHEAVERLADSLVACVREPVEIGTSKVDVGLSLGIAYTHDHGTSGESLLRRADLALYAAKASGRNAWRVFDEALDRAALETKRLEKALRNAEERDELTMYYQPQVDSTSDELIGFEALMRWHHPEDGMVCPNRFIPIAEDTGLIFELGEWALRRAARDAALWASHLTVAVNLSPKQFQQKDLAERVLAILVETGLSPSRLELEVTESLIIDDVANVLTTLRKLKGYGVSIAMDDFGTGYSSLATLQAFPFDKIKIDRSFVGQIEHNPQAAVITRAVVGLGRSLGIKVIAEGVETIEQLRFLQQERCPEIQGFLLSEAKPIECFQQVINVDHALMRPLRDKMTKHRNRNQFL